MSKHSDIISPVSIDLGAKNTGVYFAHYSAESSLEEIDKEGKVYQLEKDSYTLLMANRTAARHQRRGYDRRRMVKRLFKLIWEKHFNLTWDKDVQQTISFLLNRRGFSFLAEEYDADVLSRFPKEVYELLPDELKNEEIKQNGDDFDFDSAITEWTQRQDAEQVIKEKYEAIETSLYLVKLRVACDKYIQDGKYEEGKKDSNKLQSLNKNIFERLRNMGVQGLEQAGTGSYRHTTKKGEEKTFTYSYGDKVNLQAYINDAGETKSISDSICALGSTSDAALKLWDFNAGSFKLENAVFERPNETKENPKKRKNENEKWVKTHLHHLAFALHKTLDQLQSGGRHRSKYFEEVKGVLGNNAHTHGYLKHFCDNLVSGKYPPLDVEKLHNLIGHLSNLELKPLRKYFNDKRHRNDDHWDKDRLTKKFENWILREWRVNPQKDKLKAKDANYDYRKLRKLWNDERSGTVVDFWLKTDPNLTVPPYQDNNNRRPPRCQSLILNVGYLDSKSKYPEWQKWLKSLKSQAGDYLEDYETKLKELKSGKQKPYFSDETTGMLKTDSGRRNFKQLDARMLQFILDRVKANDPLNLNEIYSRTKKYRQAQSTAEEKQKAEEQLEKAIDDSKLPESLKTKRDYKNEALFADHTFLHLVCKYYKLRQRAKDGRLFIHPEYRPVKGRGYENTGRFDDKDHLLTYCNHKPRQKRYQLLNDLAGLLQVSSDKLKSHVQERDGNTIDEKIVGWLSDINGLPTNCTTAAKEQKDRRGRLKLDIQNVLGLIYHHRKQSEEPSNKEIKGILKNSKVNEAHKLYSFCNRAKEKCIDITKDLYDNSRQQQWQQDLDKNPASAVYLLAQVNNLVFKDRSGNANTCAVCSMDNAQRMQMLKTEDGGSTAKAQRLPAISTRLIDGAVMRMARIVGGAIAKDKWQRIKIELEQANKVCVPIITESNRFEFEPSKEELVKNQRTKLRKGKPLERGDELEIFQSKNDRIKQANPKGICPYEGTKISVEGEIDHIIPRKSQWGTLNDEANLIWASVEGNQHKTNMDVSLAQLHAKYKKSVFPGKDDTAIKQWIIDQIYDVNEDKFKFGEYRNFDSLEQNQQKAFRHALFLVGDSLRNKVIQAIDNRNRAFVNGTQRYFAEVLANTLYKKAKTETKGKQHLLSFDYFGVPSDGSSGSVPFVRKKLESQKDDSGRCLHPELQKHEKYQDKENKDKRQTPYSHLIDAKVAFMIALSAHYKKGTFKIKVPFMSSMEYIDKHGEPHDLYKIMKISEESFDLSQGELKRDKPSKTFFSHRSIHRDGIYAEHYIPILVHEERNEVRIGFDWDNSIELKDDESNRENLYFVLRFGLRTNELNIAKEEKFESLRKCLGGSGLKAKNGYFPISFDVQAIHAYYIENYNTARGYREYDDKMRFLRALSYRTERQEITVLEKAEEVLCCKQNFYASVPGSDKKVMLPVKKEWDSLIEQWHDTNLTDDAFLREFLREPKEKQPHEKVRKKFSLPIKTREGKILLKRSSWNKRNIFQIVNDSDSRKVDAKVFVPVFIKSKRRLGKLLSESAYSIRLFLLSGDEYYNQVDDDLAVIHPKVWHSIELNDELRELSIRSLEYRIDNNTRPQIRLGFLGRLKQCHIDAILQHGLLKPKEQKKVKEILAKVTVQGERIEYTGSGFTKGICRVLMPVLAAFYQ